MRAYLINLERAVERRTRMKGLLEALGLAHEIVPAVDSRAMAGDVADWFDFHDRTTATDAEMVCVLSHMKAWETFVRAGAPAALFLEDDLHFAPNFAEVLDQLETGDDADAVWKLETFGATVTASRRPQQRLRTCTVHQIYSNHAGTAAYVLTRGLALRLLEQRRGFRRAIDTELFDPEQRSIAPMRVFQCIPAPAIQDMNLKPLPTEPFLASHVGQDRHDVITGRALRDPPAVKKVKGLARPLYTRIVSLFLGLRGTRRVSVRFGQR